MRTQFYAKKLLGRGSCKRESDKPMLKKYGIIGLGLAVQHEIHRISLLCSKTHKMRYKLR